jgi:TonB family protein
MNAMESDKSVKYLRIAMIVSVVFHVIAVAVVYPRIKADSTPPETVMLSLMEIQKEVPKPPERKIIRPKKKEPTKSPVEPQVKPIEGNAPSLDEKPAPYVRPQPKLAEPPPRISQGLLMEIPEPGGREFKRIESDVPDLIPGSKGSFKTDRPDLPRDGGGPLKGADRMEMNLLEDEAGGPGKPLFHESDIGEGGGNTPGIPLPENFQIMGQVSSRNVMDWKKPDAAGLTREVEIYLHFWVTPSGQVVDISPERKGDPDLEKKAIEALRTWRFAPLPPDTEQVRQDGIIAIKFELR